MKRDSPQNLFKKRLFGLIAVFLLLYTVADVSVLEYYCGGEALGISSFQVEANAQTHLRDRETSSFVTDNSEQPVPHNSPDESVPHDDCICSCAHILVNCGYFEPTLTALVFNRQTYFYFPKDRSSESHPPHLFRPPRVI